MAVNSNTKLRRRGILTSLKLSVHIKAPLPPPTMTTPFPWASEPVVSRVGGRDLFALNVALGSAVTRILPSLTSALKLWSADGAGASSNKRSFSDYGSRAGRVKDVPISPVHTLKHAVCATA